MPAKEISFGRAIRGYAILEKYLRLALQLCYLDYPISMCLLGRKSAFYGSPPTAQNIVIDLSRLTWGNKYKPIGVCMAELCSGIFTYEVELQ